MNAVRITVIEARPLVGMGMKAIAEEEFPGAVVTFLHAFPCGEVIADLILCAPFVAKTGEPEFPEALGKFVCLAPVLVYGITGHPHTAEKCLRAGADGALCEGASPGEIKREMRTLLSLSCWDAAASPKGVLGKPILHSAPEVVPGDSRWLSSNTGQACSVISGACGFA